MIEKRALWAPLAVAAAMLTAAGPCPLRAQVPDEREGHADHDRARQARIRGEIAPLEEIIATVHRRFHGDIVSTELEHSGGIWTYEFKVIDDDGRLREVKVDAHTGLITGGE
ncbi:MAG: PepSY domain-containing protein [Azospirillaceae bacterium]|nr:PepSY domain-containing protein [Azospirillaceae bacterium]